MQIKILVFNYSFILIFQSFRENKFNFTNALNHLMKSQQKEMIINTETELLIKAKV